MMKIYLLTQDRVGGYDTYDSAVVAAKTELEARKTSPSGYYTAGKRGLWHFSYADGKIGEPESMSSWADWTDVKAEFIGHAAAGVEAGVICASFNAG